MPGMPVLINSLLAAIPKLGSVTTLCCYLVLILGVAGTEFFKGTLHYRCALPGFTETAGHATLVESELGELSAAAESARRALEAVTLVGRSLKSGGPGGGPGGGDAAFDTLINCDPSAEVDACPSHVADSKCMYFDDNMNHGVTTFDNLGWSAIVILQTITFDSWTLPMYGVIDGTSSSAPVLYFLFIVLVGGFFLVNLFLAVLYLGNRFLRCFLFSYDFL